VPEQIIPIPPFPEVLEEAKADGDSLLAQVAREVPSISIAVAEYDDERMDILDVSDEWIWDAGRPNDFTHSDLASRFSVVLDYWREALLRNRGVYILW
jgi:hypothetical protein